MSSTTKLQFARKKLLLTEIPFQLRVVSYLRISCSVAQKEDLRYSNLMRALISHDVDWWKTCRINMAGGLTSSDPTINALLHPIEALYQSESLLLAA
ncbi:MAG TPA: hypothetical protein V6C78_05565 [Crinalium sp.]|jgi:hypothetical protein